MARVQNPRHLNSASCAWSVGVDAAAAVAAAVVVEVAVVAASAVVDFSSVAVDVGQCGCVMP